MSNYDLIFLTTHQNDDHINKLIDSIDTNIINTKILVIIVSQECDIEFNSNNELLRIAVIKTLKMSLSNARNIALDYLCQNSISSEYIMFPDDDSSFDQIFFKNFFTILNSNKNYITPIYKEGTKELYFGKKTKENRIIAPNDHQLIGSPNQIILYDSLKSEIKFDEKLGVGAKFGSSEDFDLFLKLHQKANEFLFTNQLYSYHPAKVAAYKNVKLADIVNRFENYSSGFAYVIFKYKLFSLIPEYLFRTFAAFIIFGLKFNFKLSIAYFVQFFIRIKLLSYFLFNKASYE